DASGGRGEFEDLWPLQLLDLRDEDMMDTLFRLLRTLPQVVEYYLDQFIFPETMEHQGLKLAANGQDVGGGMLFEAKLGFSGTPSDLVPLELGRCMFEKGDTAMMIHRLTDPSVASTAALPAGWTVLGLLDVVAVADDPPYHALIDGGALVTGMNNLEVARHLLRRGLLGMDGAVYLDEMDRKMIVTRSGGMRPTPLAQCHVPPDKRFTFYDQVHTTGMDIPQHLSAVAAVTLGKDMVFRDYAQGAFRMRGIGRGQRIKVLVIPEVQRLIDVQVRPLSPAGAAALTCLTGHQVAAGAGMPAMQRREELQGLLGAARERRVLCDVCAWLTVNAMRSERTQWNLLMEQQAQNVWRKRAYRALQGAHREFGKGGAAASDPRLLACLDTFRQRVDHAIENTVPKAAKFSDKLAAMAAVPAAAGLLTDPVDAAVLTEIQRLVAEAEAQVSRIA
ncbi:unnamed protein product, partial [Phaeothamnion confervicola]